MSDEFSGVPVSPEFGAGPPFKSDRTTVVLLALMAVVAALVSALGRDESRLFVTKLSRIARDWEQQGEGTIFADAARWFIRPALAFIRKEEA